MNYTKKSFAVSSPGTQSYADNWERTFRRLNETPEKKHEQGCDIFENGLFCNCELFTDESGTRKFWPVPISPAPEG